MNQFTLKDLIEYNSPCKLCGSLSSLILHYNGRSIEVNKKQCSRVSFSLQLTYNPEEAKVIVFDTKTNTYISSFNLEDDKINFSLICRNHNVTINTNIVSFKDTFIEPLTIYSEFISLRNFSNEITVTTYPASEKTIIRSHTIKNTIRDINSNIEVEISQLPISKWKNKENLESYIKAYLAFA